MQQARTSPARVDDVISFNTPPAHAWRRHTHLEPLASQREAVKTLDRRLGVLGPCEEHEPIPATLVRPLVHHNLTLQGRTSLFEQRLQAKRDSSERVRMQRGVPTTQPTPTTTRCARGMTPRVAQTPLL